MRNLLLVAGALLVAALATGDGALATLLGGAALVTAGVAWFESGPASTRELAVVATLGSAAAAGRVLFSALPGVQPVTVVAVVAGVALGLRAGVATGAIAAFVSNLFLGQGIWTPQQMLGWAACGAVGALLAPVLRGRIQLAVVCFVLGLLVQREHGHLALVRVLPAHVGARWSSCSGEGSGSTSRTRSETSCSRSRSAPSCGGCSTATATACGRWSCGRDAPYLAALVLAVSPAQFVQGHESGGAFAEPGGTADASLTSWAVLGLRAAGQPPPASLAYLQSQEATLAAHDRRGARRAGRGGARRPANRAARPTSADGDRPQIGPTVNSTCWAVLALGASSKQTTRWLLAHQAKNGGFAWAIGGQPDSNDTAAALEALRVAGVHGAPVTRAAAFLLTFQNATAASS